MTFKNRPNEQITTTDGREFFISRSAAVIPQIYCLVGPWGKQEPFILVNKRGPSCPDHVGKWALPCGYLDWDESAKQATRREIWEECDFDLILISSNDIVFSLFNWALITNPEKDARQNILIHMTQVFTRSQLPPITKEPDDETSDVAWMSVKEALETDFAFGHQYNIYCCLQHLHKKSLAWPEPSPVPWHDPACFTSLPDLFQEAIINAPESVRTSQKVLTFND